MQGASRVFTYRLSLIASKAGQCIDGSVMLFFLLCDPPPLLFPFIYFFFSSLQFQFQELHFLETTMKTLPGFHIAPLFDNYRMFCFIYI